MVIKKTDEFLGLEVYPFVDLDTPEELFHTERIIVALDGSIHRRGREVRLKDLLIEAKGLLAACEAIKEHLLKDGAKRDNIFHEISTRSGKENKPQPHSPIPSKEAIDDVIANVYGSWEMLSPMLGMEGKGDWLEHALRNKRESAIWGQLRLPKGSWERINDRADRLEGLLNSLSFYQAVFEEFNILLKVLGELEYASDMKIINVIMDWLLFDEIPISEVYEMIEARNVTGLWEMLGVEIYGRDEEGTLGRMTEYYERMNKAQYLREVHNKVKSKGGSVNSG